MASADIFFFVCLVFTFLFLIIGILMELEKDYNFKEVIRVGFGETVAFET